MAGQRPKKRNPVMTLVMVIGVYVVANILGGVLASATGVALLSSVMSLVGYAFFCVIVGGMVTELKAFTGGDITPWWVWVPILNLFLLVAKVPAEMTKAKQMAGVQAPVKPVWMYFLFSPFALAADLNDLAG